MTAAATKRAVAYNRVSTREQVEHGHNLKGDTERCLERINREPDWEHVDTYVDGGEQGDDPTRPQYQRLLADVAAGRVDVIVIPALDRFGRDSVEIQTRLALFDREGVRVVSLRESIDRDTPEGRLQTGILAQFAEFEKAKIKARTRAALQQRKANGLPVGAMPLGYRANAIIGPDGEATTRRVEDPPRAAVARRIFEMAASGLTPGEIARLLNRERVPPPRKKSRAWETRTVRRIIENRCYVGDNGYPQLIDTALFDRALGNLRRLDPVAAAARQAGRKSPEEYVLRGIAKCSRCGAPLYTRRYASGRHYICANTRQATGLCDAPPIPANVLEAKTLDHLHDFRLNIEEWLATRVAAVHEERASLERAAAGLRAEAAKVTRRVEAAHRQHDQALDEEDDALAAVTLRAVARVEAQQTEALARVAEAEARVGEWTAEPDVNAALDYYNEIVDLIEGRVAKARGAAELNVALRDLLAYVHVDTRPASEAFRDGWIPVVPDDAPARVIRATFVVRGEGVVVRPDGTLGEPDRAVVAWAGPEEARVTSRRSPWCTTSPVHRRSRRRSCRASGARGPGPPGA
ncbi:recombinase family protein [Conexibacter sp. SYSU D00693]|uniref:recombinase family protein n=1 Tax=Conexibacter sp. SYSU D00693 TaxID=2812560 RepID=UPI00196AC181|nr:recombinase family protein [Conexibacter sp. SYSU D00693]